MDLCTINKLFLFDNGTIYMLYYLSLGKMYSHLNSKK